MSRPPKLTLRRTEALAATPRSRPDPTTTMAVLAALLVLVAGLAYTLLRDPGWESRATVTLEPAALANGNRVGLLDVFDRSGTLGTYVETISSADTLEAAGSPPIKVEARSIPDTRVIEVDATGSDRGAVEDGLTDVVDTVTSDPVEVTGAERREMDLWTVEPTEAPSRASLQGPSDFALIAGTLVVAALAGLFVFVLGRRSLLTPARRPGDEPSPRAPAQPPVVHAAGANSSGPVRAGQAGPPP